QGSHIRSNTIRLNFDDILTPTLLLHIGAGFLDVNSNPEVPSYNPVTGIGFTGGNASPPAFPTFSGLLGAQGGSANLGSYGPGTSFIIRNLKPTSTVSMTWVHNNH